MSRTTLCLVTAAALALLALGTMAVRYHALGDEVKLPGGARTWKVTLAVQGTASGNAQVSTVCPMDMGRQHVLQEDYQSAQMLHKAPEIRGDDRRHITWQRRAGVADGPFRLRAEYQVAVDALHPSSSMEQMAKKCYAAPRQGEYLSEEVNDETTHEDITAAARRLTDGLSNPTDVAEALYNYVANEVQNEPSVQLTSPGAVACLHERSGDSLAKSRLLAALLRNRGIPARVVNGVALNRGAEQRGHSWVEAWVHGRWLPICAFNHFFGKVPSTYLVFCFGDQPLVKGKNVKGLHYACLIEKGAAPEGNADAAPRLTRFFRAVSLYQLPPTEQHLAEFLLLLPIAALIICFFRNLVGLNSFGTFAPALVGLAFRELHSLPGILVFVSILLVGWMMRRILDYYHLLQVPRVSLMLSLIVLVLLSAVVAANFHDVPVTKYISLFPMVILTGMVERFWTLETEDSTAASFKTLFATMFIAAVIALTLSLQAVCRHLFRFPETVGIIMAAQLLIGRYTGYRLMELWRFREFLTRPPQPPLRLVTDGSEPMI